MAFQTKDFTGQPLYEILKIWVPTHGVINVYRKPKGGASDLGSILELRAKAPVLTQVFL